MSTKTVQLVGEFIGRSVCNATLRRYKTGWNEWQKHLTRTSSQEKSVEPFLQTPTNSERATVLCNMFRIRYAEGKRGKTAHWMVAAIRKHFAMNRMSTNWLELPMVAMTRKACRRSLLENRAYIKSGEGKTKLPVW